MAGPEAEPRRHAAVPVVTPHPVRGAGRPDVRRRPLFLAVDFGTSHIRAAVGRSTGAPLSLSSRPVGYAAPPDGPDVASEFDPASVWRDLCRCVRDAVRNSGAKPGQIAGIGVTSQRLGLVIIGADGKEVYGGPNRDARGVFEGAEIDATLGDSIWQATGHGPALVLAWSKLAWFRNHAPDRFSRARSAAGLADWLAYRLTGVLLMESALAVESGLAFVATGLPAAVLKDSLGLGGIDLPVSCEAGQIVGTLKSAPASELGLREGTPVVACGPDTQAGLAGLGVCEPGSAGVIAGWSAAVQLVTAQPVFDQTRSLWTGRHILHRRWVLEGNAGEMGGAYEWLAGLISGGRASSRTYGELDRLAAAVEPGARGVSAYLGPSFTSMSHIGLKTGALLFPAPLAFEPPDRGSLARAAIESFAFAIRYNLDRLRLVAGDWQDVAAGGGMVRSRTFREVTAATTGRPVAFGTAGDATLRGALSVTGAGTGDGLTMERALEGRRREVHVVEPSAADAARYEDLYLNWRARERRILEMEL